MKNIKRLFAIVFCLTIAASSHAQVKTGFPPFSSMAGGPDSINLANMNVHWSFPIIGKAGRGMPFSYSLEYNSSVWGPVNNGTTLAWQPDPNWGWGTQTNAALGTLGYYANVDSYGALYYDQWSYVDRFGTAHTFNGDIYGVNWTTSDGSGYTITLAFENNINVAILKSRSGDTTKWGADEFPYGFHLGVPEGPITDRNGNQVSVSTDGNTFTDTLGNTVLTITGGNPLYYNYSTPSGGQASYAVKYQSYSVKTNFGASGMAEYNGTASLVSEIDLPDIATNPSDKYTFSYEQTPGYPGYTTGRIASVTLPTGGSISYDYFNGFNGIYADGSTAGVHRTVNDGVNTNVWAYWTNGSGSTTVVDPQNNETDLTFTSTYETLRQVYQGRSGAGSTVLETIVTCWNGVGPSTCGTGASVTPPIQNRIQYIELPGTTSRHDDYFNGNGLLTETDDLDWGYALLQKKLITYAPLGNNILDRPSSAILQDPSGNVLAQTNFYYDQTAVTATSGTPQHIAVSGSRGNLTQVDSWVTGSTYLHKYFTYYDTGTPNTATDVNGAVTTYNYGTNLTANCNNSFPVSVTPPQGTAGVDLTTSTTWDCNGGVATSATDPNGRTVATTGWDSNFWRPTAVTDQAMGYTQLFSYTPTSADTHWGINNTSTVHTKATVDGLGRVHVSQREQGYNSPNFDSVETDYDPDGRPYFATTGYVGTAGQSYCSSHGLPSNCTPPGTTTLYDALGRPTKVTDAGGGEVDYAYNNNDVLVTIVPSTGDTNKKRQYEYDVLGRLTSVCEVTSGTGSGACGQSNPLNGYLTKYTYDAAGRLLTVTQNAQTGGGTQQTRSFTYDNLGRMLSETNPENGTRNYYYDADGNCGGVYNGDLQAVTDAAGNRICNAYDALHRLIQTLYVGPASGVTPARSFHYDAGTLNGQQMLNAKGRLAYAFNCFSSCATVPSALYFSYSPRGEVTDTWEQTQHSGGFYHTTASYWSHGPVQNLNLYAANGSTLIPTITYGASDASGLDVEGRITKVMASSGVNPVPSATINTTDPSTSSEPLGALLSVNLGTTTSGQYDSDSFTYDPNTGRLHTYQFSMNGQTDTGTLTWNANGGLQQLRVADNIPGTTDSQTCNYTSDDLGRIATVNCGSSIWQQNFSYDPFGNVTKTLPQGSIGVAFPPASNAYDQGTNRINYTGFTYDSNGNLLNDVTAGSSHQYTWDANGRPVCVDGVVLIYDAMGRMVEQARGGTCTSPGTNYQQVVYGPGGSKLALMNVQTLNKAFVPLPGGATAVYGLDILTPPHTALLYYRHSDWLGSSRLASTPARTLYSSTAYAPFGEPYDENGTTDRSFTGENQDTVAGLDDFKFREQTPVQGRWISPDPAGLAAVSLTNPQSWNRYTYALNSPLLLTDSLGLNTCPPGSGDTCTDVFDRPPDDPPQTIPCQGCWDGGTPAVFLTGDWCMLAGCEGFGPHRYTPQGTTVAPGNRLPNGDVPLNPFAQAALGGAGRLAGFVTSPTFIAEFYGASLVGGFGLYGAGVFEGGLTITGIEASTPVTEEGLATITAHLNSLEGGMVEENQAMIDRLADAFQSGREVTGADFNFYNHELQEAEMVANGMEQEAAHAATLESQGVSPFSVYHPEVIQDAFFEDGSPVFNENWWNYWGLR